MNRVRSALLVGLALGAPSDVYVEPGGKPHLRSHSLPTKQASAGLISLPSGPRAWLYSSMPSDCNEALYYHRMHDRTCHGAKVKTRAMSKSCKWVRNWRQREGREAQAKPRQAVCYGWLLS